MKINWRVLGAGMMTTGPILMNFVDKKTAWWLGITFIVCGPILMAVTWGGKPKRRQKRK